LEFTKTGPSVKADVLKKLAGKHPVVPLIIEYRELETIAQRYTTGLLDNCRADGRIHCSYNITGTRTGRFSCSGPNMQQIPSRNPILGKMVKNCFIADPGHVLIQLDYSQLEYREAANLSGDPVMIAIYEAGLDLHRRTAELIAPHAWDIPQATMEGYDDKKIKPYRGASKGVNFGALYGRGAAALARELGITVELARHLVKLIMGKFEVLNAWIEQQISICKRQGFVNTYVDGLVARRRPLVGIAEKGNDEINSKCRNGAINTPVQGTAADRMLRSLNAAESWERSTIQSSSKHPPIGRRKWRRPSSTSWNRGTPRYRSSRMSRRVRGGARSSPYRGTNQRII
jgi:DNA polymerase-1